MANNNNNNHFGLPLPVDEELQKEMEEEEEDSQRHWLEQETLHRLKEAAELAKYEDMDSEKVTSDSEDTVVGLWPCNVCGEDHCYWNDQICDFCAFGQ